MKPAFLDQPHFSQRTPRSDTTMIDYASPVTRYVHERSYRWCDAFAAGLLVGVLVTLALGGL